MGFFFNQICVYFKSNIKLIQNQIIFEHKRGRDLELPMSLLQSEIGHTVNLPLVKLQINLHLKHQPNITNLKSLNCCNVNYIKIYTFKHI